MSLGHWQSSIHMGRGSVALLSARDHITSELGVGGLCPCGAGSGPFVLDLILSNSRRLGWHRPSVAAWPPPPRQEGHYPAMYQTLRGMGGAMMQVLLASAL